MKSPRAECTVFQFANQYHHYTQQLLAKTTQRAKLNKVTIKKLRNMKDAWNIIANVLLINMLRNAKYCCLGIPYNHFCTLYPTRILIV